MGEGSRVIHVGVIGAGGIADLVHLPGLAKCPGVRLAAISDVNASAARALADRYGIGAVWEDYRRLLEDPAIGAVVVCVPNSLHHRIALDAIAAGKHVLCEKPLGLNLREAEGMARAMAVSGRRGMMAFTYRFAPCVRYARHLVDAGHLGTIRHVRALFNISMPETWLHWRSTAAENGGALVDLGSHLVDFGRWFAGEARSVAARTATFLTERRTADGMAVHRPDVDDAAGLWVDYANGATGSLEMTRLGKGWGRRGHIHLEVTGARGSVVCCLLRPYEIRVGGGVVEDQMATIPVPNDFLTLPDSPRNPRTDPPLIGYRYDQAWAFVRSIREGRDLGPTFEDGRAAQALTDAAQRAARERRWVDLREVEG